MTKPYDLAPYKLTLPHDKDGKFTGKAYEVLDPLVYKGPWFYSHDQRLVFRCPDKGATTPNAKYPRCELRDFREWGGDKAISDKVKLKIMALSEGDKVVIHQIHDKSEPWLKIVAWMKNGQIIIRALVKTKAGAKDTEIVFDPIKLGQSLISYIEHVPARGNKGQYLKIKMNKSMSLIDINRPFGTGAYFKRGAYLQSAANMGRICEIHHV